MWYLLVRQANRTIGLFLKSFKKHKKLIFVLHFIPCVKFRTYHHGTYYLLPNQISAKLLELGFRLGKKVRLIQFLCPILRIRCFSFY